MDQTKTDLLRTMHGRDFSASTILEILDEIFRQTSSPEEEDALADRVRDVIWGCKTEQEALSSAINFLKAR